MDITTGKKSEVGRRNLRLFRNECVDSRQVAFDHNQVVPPVTYVALLSKPKDQIVTVSTLSRRRQGRPMAPCPEQVLANIGQVANLVSPAVKGEMDGCQLATGMVLGQMGEQGKVEEGMAQLRLRRISTEAGQQAAHLSS